MEDIYISELINNLEKTEFYDAENNVAMEYDIGIQRLFRIFSEHKRRKTQVFFVGNGGSAAIASHMTADFMKNGGMKTYSLYDSAVSTCMGNDYGYEYVFSRPMGFLVREDDLVVVISSSGKSENIINAIAVAKEKGAEIITLTGFSRSSKAKEMGDFNVYVPCDKYGMIESIHNIILQQIVDMIMERDGVSF